VPPPLSGRASSDVLRLVLAATEEAALDAQAEARRLRRALLLVALAAPSAPSADDERQQAQRAHDAASPEPSVELVAADCIGVLRFCHLCLLSVFFFDSFADVAQVQLESDRDGRDEPGDQHHEPQYVSPVLPGLGELLHVIHDGSLLLPVARRTNQCWPQEWSEDDNDCDHRWLSKCSPQTSDVHVSPAGLVRV
jgi:hypothetical protein